MVLSRSRDELLRFEPGAQVKGYEIVPAPGAAVVGGTVEPLGRGGSGVVFLARQQLGLGVSLKRAIKFFVYRDDIAEMTPHERTGPVSGSEFLDEVTNISQLSHEYLVKVVDAGTYDSYDLEIPFIVTDYVPGPTLKSVLKPSEDADSEADRLRDEFLSNPTLLLDFLLRLGAAVAYVHDQGFAHCDIAPKNVFIDDRAGIRPVLGDLGVMKDLDTPRDQVFVVGTRRFMSPAARPLWNTYVDWSTFRRLQPAWDVFSYCRTALDLAEKMGPQLASAGANWLRALRAALEEERAGSYGSMTEILGQIEFLLPANRETAAVEELSGSTTNKKRRLMPLEVPELSGRMRKLVRHPALVRLARVPQVTTVRQMFPGAKHDRFEHSLGVMETVRRYLLALLDDEGVLEHLRDRKKLELALLGGLLFNLTRFPFGAVVGEIRDKDPAAFQEFAKENLLKDVLRMQDAKGRTLPDLIATHFPRVDMDSLKSLLLGRNAHFDDGDRFVFSLLSSSLDARVIDFVRRDSLHIGITRGDVVGLGELLPHLTVHGHRLAVRSSGVTEAEQILSLRYWLFNRAYWNRANRAYSAMVRFLLLELASIDGCLSKLRAGVLVSSEEELLQLVRQLAEGSQRDDLATVAGWLCAPEQELYRAVLDASLSEDTELKSAHVEIGKMDFQQLGDLARRLADAVTRIGDDDGSPPPFLVDLPFEPGSNKLGTDIMVVRPDDSVVNLTDFSAIVAGLVEGVDRHLRRLRVFASPMFLDSVADRKALEAEVRSFLIDYVSS